MSIRTMLGAQLLVLVPMLLLGLACTIAPVSSPPSAAPAVSPVPSRSVRPSPSTLPVATVPSAKCHYQDHMPDPACTPGAIDMTVTQDNIRLTICMPGYTASVRVNLAALKRQQMREYGDVTPEGVLLPTAAFEEDHRVALEVGGEPDEPKNLWPEPIAAAHAKDRLENYIHAAICASPPRMSLAEGQAVFLGDWEAYLQTHAEAQ